jgi:uncharacterized protein YbjT (DUF2867 family)
VKILLLGATGFIGSAVAARLAREGHEVVGLARHIRGAGIPGVRYIAFDIGKAQKPEDWSAVLAGAGAVVNCAGALQDAPGESLQALHATSIGALFAACESQGVRRVVHFSAAGAERGASAFSKSKSDGDARLMARDLDWFVLRPSVVVGRAAYGGSALLRGLAGLPILALPDNAGPLQLVWLDDVVETVVACLQPKTPARRVLELAGPKRYAFAEAVQLFRRWLRWRKQWLLAIPGWASAALFKPGDALRLLGWRPPIASNAQRELVYGAIGDPKLWTEATGIVPRDVEAALLAEPASVQERWFARLYFLKAAIIGIFGLFWLGTGSISLGPGWDSGMDAMRQAQVSEQMGALSVLAGGCADIVIGCAILYRPTTRYGLYAAIVITLIYIVTGTILLPGLWKEPLGPMLKVVPILVLNLTALAVLEDR